MKKHFFLSLFLFTAIFSGPAANAQYIEQVQEITAGNFFGYGARQMAMGGAGMMSFDGNALFYNPANLARIPRIEMNLGFSHQKYNDASNVREVRRIVDYSGVVTDAEILTPRFAGFTPVRGSAEVSKSDTRLNTAVLTIPYPTYRGSLVFGFGTARVANFDRVFRLSHSDSASPGNRIIALGDEYQSGGLTQWGGGFGIDISPRISFGLGAFLYTGKHEYNWEYALDSLPDLEYRQEDLIIDDYVGWNIKSSLSMQLNQYLSLGLAVETPLKLNVDEEVTTTYAGDDNIYLDIVEYSVKRPFVFSGAVALRYREAMIELDLDYTDWSQMEYSDNRNMEVFNDDIEQYYDNVLRYRIGGEYVVPTLGLSLRAGYFNDPLPVKDQFINSDRKGYSFGFGLLIDQVLTLDFAWVHGGYERNSDFVYSSTYDTDDELISNHNLIVDEDISYDRIYVTSAYRF